MSVIRINCPHCGVPQELDDSRENNFCTECGEKILASDIRSQSQEEAPVQPQVQAHSYVSQSQEEDELILENLRELLRTEGNFVTNLSSVEECAAQYDRWVGVIDKYKKELPALSHDVSKETAINEVIAFCDRIAKTKISYLAGGVDKEGKDIVKVYSPDKTRSQNVRDSKSFFISAFNNLPSRVELSKILNENLDISSERVVKLKASVKETRDKLKSSEKEFWANNPEVANRKRDAKIKSLLIVAIGLIVAIIFVAIAAIKKISLLYAAAFAVLVLSVFIRSRVTSGSVKKIETETFPESLKSLASLLESYQTELSAAEAEHKQAQEKLAAFDATRK